MSCYNFHLRNDLQMCASRILTFFGVGWLVQREKVFNRSVPPVTLHSPWRAIDNPAPRDSYSGGKPKGLGCSSPPLEANDRQYLHQLPSR